MLYAVGLVGVTTRGDPEATAVTTFYELPTGRGRDTMTTTDIVAVLTVQYSPQ